MIYKETDKKLLYWLYPILFVVCYFQAMNIIPPGLPGEGKFIWPFRLIMLYLGVKAYKLNSYKCTPLNFFIGYSLLSVVLYLINGYPLGLYFNEVAFFLPAVLFCYIGMESSDTTDNFYKYTLWAIAAFFVIGLYLYFLPPSWYQNAWVRRMESKWYLEGMNVSYDHIAENMRFSSFMLTSYATEYFGIFAVPMAISFMAREEIKKLKWGYLLIVLISIVCVVLSMQRSAILASFLVLLFYFIYDNTHYHKGGKFYILLLALVVIFFTTYSQSELGIRILERFDAINIDDAFNESRVEQNKNAFSAMQNIVFGSGIGTCGSSARRLGLPAVTDSNYMKLFFEQGIIGIIIFLVLVVKTLLRVKSNFKYLFAEGAIIASYLIAMIGSNALSFSLFSPLFWYAVGRIWNDEYLYNLKIKELHI